MGVWVVEDKRSGNLAFSFRYRGRTWWKSTGLPYGDPVHRKRAQAMKALLDAAAQDGTLEVEYARCFPGDTRFAGAVAPTATTPRLDDFAGHLFAERVPPLYPHSYAKVGKQRMATWINPRLGHLALDELRRDDVVALRTAMLDAGLSVKYAKNVVGTVCMVLGEAVRREVIGANVATDLEWPRQPRKRIETYTQAEIERVLGYFRAVDLESYRYALSLTDTGMRPSESAALLVADADTNGQGALDVRSSRVAGRTAGTKTRKSERTLAPISPRLLAEIQAIKRERGASAHLFVSSAGNPIRQERFMERKWTPALERLKIPHRRLYALRHTFISTMLSDPANPANPQWVADYTGTSIEMLHRTYARFIRSTATPPMMGRTEAPAEVSAPPESLGEKRKHSAEGRKKAAAKRVSEGARTLIPSSLPAPPDQAETPAAVGVPSIAARRIARRKPLRKGRSRSALSPRIAMPHSGKGRRR